MKIQVQILNISINTGNGEYGQQDGDNDWGYVDYICRDVEENPVNNAYHNLYNSHEDAKEEGVPFGLAVLILIWLIHATIINLSKLKQGISILQESFCRYLMLDTFRWDYHNQIEINIIHRFGKLL